MVKRPGYSWGSGSMPPEKFRNLHVLKDLFIRSDFQPTNSVNVYM